MLPLAAVIYCLKGLLLSCVRIVHVGSMYVSLLWIIWSIIKLKLKVLSHLYESSILVVILKTIGCYIILFVIF